MTPVSIPNVIARKNKEQVPEEPFLEGISRPRKDRERGQPSTITQPGDEYAVSLASDDPASIFLLQFVSFSAANTLY